MDDRRRLRRLAIEPLVLIIKGVISVRQVLVRYEGGGGVRRRVVLWRGVEKYETKNFFRRSEATAEKPCLGAMLNF